jgi:hypothetical protein
MRNVISFSIVSAALVAFASACAVDASSDENLTGIAGQASCTNNEGTNAMIAALAVAVGKELHRWKVGTDFTIVRGYANQEHLALTPTGLAQCQNGCANVKALLLYQDARYDQQIVFPGGQKLSSWSYAARLVAGYRAQLTCESRPSNRRDNPDNCPAEDHKLTLAGTSPAACGTNYTFKARTPTGGMLVAPSLLRNRLLWTGGASNPYVAFTSTNSTVSIDPTWGMVEDDNTSAPVCYIGCTMISSTTNYVGACCKVDNVQGRYIQGASSAVFKCQIPGCM